MPNAPAECSFPTYPAAWYLFGESGELCERPVSKIMLGRRLVAFRGSSGKAAILDAACSHLGADLGRGRVVGDCLQCPFHQWEYEADGRCGRIPTQDIIPEFARQRVYPTIERHGMVFVFNGEEPLFSLPFFWGERPEDFVAGRLFSFVAECSWFMLNANGFDTAHFQSVHDRQLVAVPVIDCPVEFARRIQFLTQVTGKSLADRFIRRTIGDQVDVIITNWGGTWVSVSGRFARAISYLHIMTRPIEAQRTHVDVMVYAPRGENALVCHIVQPLVLEIRRWLTQQFMANDIRRLPGIRYNPHSLVRADHELVEFFRWVIALPQAKEAKPRKIGTHATG